jgi:hypothetical protein
MSHPQLSRRLSVVEHLTWLESLHRPTNFTFAAQIQGECSTQEIHEALIRLKKRHPLLGVKIVFDAKGVPHFSAEDIPHFLIREFILEHGKEWLQEVETELKQPFSWQTGPLIRFAIARSGADSSLLVTCHHCFADGLSVAYLIRDLLQQLANPEDEPECLPPLPPIEDLIPTAISEQVQKKFDLLPFGINFLVKLLDSYEQIKRVFLGVKYSPAKNSDGSQSKFPIPERKLISWALSETETTALVHQCKQQNTSVHAALCTAFLLAFAGLKAEDESWVRKVGSPISIRNRLSRPAGECFGYFGASALNALDCSPEQNFWDLARTFKSDLTAASSDFKIIAPLMQLQTLRPLVQQPTVSRHLIEILRFLSSGGGSPCDLTLSNLGRLDFASTYGSRKLMGLYGPFVSTYDRGNNLGVTTLGKQMFFAFVTHELPQAPDIIKQAMLRIRLAAGGL